MTRTILAGLALLMLLGGCPKGETTTSGDATPADTRPAALGLDPAERSRLRADTERRLHVVGVGDDQHALREATSERLEAARTVLEELDALAGEGLSPRDQERAALEIFATYLRAIVTSERTDFPTGEEVLPTEGPWARARIAHDAGDLETALHEGLSALRELTEQGVDSASMRVELGDWAMEAGDHELALAWYESAAQAGEAERSWGDEAGRRANTARAQALGPDAARLVEANGLVDQGDLASAHALLEELIADGEDAEVTTDARELLDLVVADATDIGVEKLARAGAILEGPGPYDDVGPLLDAMEWMPEGTYDGAELLRLQGWYRARTGQSDAATAAARKAELDATLGDARDLVVAKEYRAALKAYAKLEGTEHQSVARRESAEAAETLVREERERAGRLFVAARKQSDPATRAAELETVRGILAGLLDEFPESQYAERLHTNLAAVEREIGGLGP